MKNKKWKEVYIDAEIKCNIKS